MASDLRTAFLNAGLVSKERVEKDIAREKRQETIKKEQERKQKAKEEHEATLFPPNRLGKQPTWTLWAKAKKIPVDVKDVCCICSHRAPYEEGSKIAQDHSLKVLDETKDLDQCVRALRQKMGDLFREGKLLTYAPTLLFLGAIRFGQVAVNLLVNCPAQMCFQCAEHIMETHNKNESEV